VLVAALPMTGTFTGQRVLSGTRGSVAMCVGASLSRRVAGTTPESAFTMARGRMQGADDRGPPRSDPLLAPRPPMPLPPPEDPNCDMRAEYGGGLDTPVLPLNAHGSRAALPPPPIAVGACLFLGGSSRK